VSPEATFERWVDALERRHLADLAFPEVTRGLRAVSSAYVERRARLQDAALFSGAGKRAAFAMFYGPLHYLVVRHVVNHLPNATTIARIVDIGCGTGASGAAWASACATQPVVVGLDRNPWALREAADTYRAFGLKYRTRVVDLERRELPPEPGSALAAFTMNEVSDAARDRLMHQCITRAARGDRVLIVEPIARSTTPWWRRGQSVVERSGGRADEWRFAAELPAIVAKLDRAAGLNHRELTARSLWL